MWKTIQDQDWKEVERHLAPAFVGVTSDGQSVDRAGWIAYWKALRLSDFSLSEVAVQPAGADMVVTYVLRLTATGQGQIPRVTRAVSVWQDVKGRWILIANSATPVSQ